MDETLQKFFAAVGIVPSERKPLSWWVEKAIYQGEFYYRKSDTETLAAAVYDMGRGMQLWVYLSLPVDFETSGASTAAIEVSYVLPAYCGTEVAELEIASFYTDPAHPLQWWLDLITPSGEKVTACMVDFIRSAEKVHATRRAKLVLSGLLLEFGGEVSSDERPELLLCPETGAPTLVRGVVVEHTQTANFYTGETLARLVLETCGVRLDLLGARKTVPKHIQAGMRVDVFAYLQTFAK